MTLQRRLLLTLLACAPLVWAVALGLSAHSARLEVDELFDTEIIRLARQVQAVIGGVGGGAGSGAPAPGAGAVTAVGGEADLADLAVAVWDARGRLELVDREGAQLPWRQDATGFVDLDIGGDVWRVFYLQAPDGQRLVAAGQRVHEREELVRNLLVSQVLPWLLVLPLLLAAMAWAVRHALAPLRALERDLGRRGADDLNPLPAAEAPAELRPLLSAMNGLFARIGETLERERRFTADAAHELRTPLAVLRAQWDVVRGAADPAQRAEAERRLAAGLERLDRLVAQMLALSRLEATERLPAPQAVDWAPLVAQAMSDVLPLAERRRIELGCDWPPAGTPAFPLQGDAALLGVLLRNLLDNAVRYAPEGSAVTLRFEADALVVENDGEPLGAAALAVLGERFRRADGQAESGSGLGVSIARRVAALHGLQLRHGPRADGRGVAARVGLSTPT